MTRTVVASATREIVIGFDQPFCVIGERINPTGRKKLAAEMVEGNFDTVRKGCAGAGRRRRDHARRQRRCHGGRSERHRAEPRSWSRRWKLVQELVDVPLSIDSSVTDALEGGLRGLPRAARWSIRSPAKTRKLEAILPLIKKYDVPVVAISNDETGISEDPDVRFDVAKKDRRTRRRFRHSLAGHRRRSAGHADRRHGHRRQAGLRAGAPPARRAEGQHHLRRCPTFPSACRTATASMPASSRW